MFIHSIDVNPFLILPNEAAKTVELNKLVKSYRFLLLFQSIQSVLEAGTLQCPSCQNKYAKEMYDRNHARNAVEQLIHTQIQRGYHLNLPTNRSSTQIRFVFGQA